MIYRIQHQYRMMMSRHWIKIQHERVMQSTCMNRYTTATSTEENARPDTQEERFTIVSYQYYLILTNIIIIYKCTSITCI